MKKTAAKVACLLALAAVAALVLPAVAPAFQDVVLEQGGAVLRVTGDDGKASDEVTITYDSLHDEYVITHDILTAPPGCKFEGGGPPFNVLRCPAKGIRYIVIDLGADSDVFSMIGISIFNLGAGDTWIPPDLVAVEVDMGPGNDKVEESGGVQQPALPAAASLHPATRRIEMGGGNDSASVGGGVNTIFFGDGNGRLTAGDGTNTVTIGKGNSKVTLGGGTNAVTIGAGNSQVAVGDGPSTIGVGDGNSKVTVGDGPSVVVFGNGAPVFTGGPGPDSATFGAGNGTFTGKGGDDRASFLAPGNNTFFGGSGNDYSTMGPGNDKFTGGPGDDSARLAAGDDKGFGGSGRDSLLGGPGKDHLFGGADFDLLNGGREGWTAASAAPAGPGRSVARSVTGTGAEADPLGHPLSLDPPKRGRPAWGSWCRRAASRLG